MLSCALAQSYILLVLYRCPTTRGAAALAALGMCALSLAAPAFISPDPYAYVGDTLLGRAAYAPPGTPFTGEYAQINHLFPPPMLPSPYGPLWTTVSGLALAPFGTLLGKLIALRLIGLVSYIAFLVALRACGVAPRLLIIAMLNPALFLQYVACAHNDLLGIAILVAAGAFAARNAAIAAGLLVVSALVKLPFVILGLPVLAAVRSRSSRYLLAAVSIASAITLSYWGAGAAYFRGLAVHVPAPGPVYVLNLAVAVLALATIGFAFVGGPRLRAAVWLIPMASSYIASWYLVYALPYALARRRILAYLLIALPFVDVLVDAKFMQWWTYVVVLPIATLLAVAPSARKRRAAS